MKAMMLLMTVTYLLGSQAFADHLGGEAHEVGHGSDLHHHGDYCYSDHAVVSGLLQSAALKTTMQMGAQPDFHSSVIDMSKLPSSTPIRMEYVNGRIVQKSSPVLQYANGKISLQ